MYDLALALIALVFAWLGGYAFAHARLDPVIDDLADTLHKLCVGLGHRGRLPG